MLYLCFLINGQAPMLRQHGAHHLSIHPISTLKVSVTSNEPFTRVNRGKSCDSDVLWGLVPLKRGLTNGLTWAKANYISIRAIMEGLIEQPCDHFFFSFFPTPPPHQCAWKRSREFTEYLSTDAAQDQIQTMIKKEYYISGYLMRPAWFNASHFKSGHSRVA